MDQPQVLNVFVNVDGTSVQYLHEDQFAHASDTPLDARRASDVEFDAATQQWVATLNDGTEIARHPRRAEVLNRERTIIDAMLIAGESIPAIPD